MKKAFITGISGFVGPYLKKELENRGYKVFGTDISEGDIRDKKFVFNKIKEVNPDEIYHLAGFSSVGMSFKEPEKTFEINVEGTRNLLSACKKHAPASKILIVSSAEVYGKASIIPISESEPLKEGSPYSKSRIAQENLIKEFPELFIVISRSFNHTGPGQPLYFVLSDFCMQVAEIEKGTCKPRLFTGDLSVVRDFSDVRDVVKAYNVLLIKGIDKEAYNVGSGKGYSLKELLDKILSFTSKKIEIRKDPNKMRPIDIPELVADVSKIKKLGWYPAYSIDKTLEDLLNYWRNKPKL
ncbi:NAD-dependent epimerase/dehydratase family protein [Candidatus Peregrinibacteria bacterium]|nr:NAD-dependent epimerase/dehydratase family protein [Candidatus Peregrinibacteria bacterium]